MLVWIDLRIITQIDILLNILKKNVMNAIFKKHFQNHFLFSPSRLFIISSAEPLWNDVEHVTLSKEKLKTCVTYCKVEHTKTNNIVIIFCLQAILSRPQQNVKGFVFQFILLLLTFDKMEVISGIKENTFIFITKTYIEIKYILFVMP